MADVKYTVDMDNDMDNLKIHKTDNESLKKLSEKILDNRLIIFPTESVYKIGCSIFNPSTIHKLHKIQKPDYDTPITIQCMGFYDASTMTDMTGIEKDIFKSITGKFWPGNLTILLKANDIIDTSLKTKDGFIYVSASKNHVIQKLLQFSQSPIASFSANLSEDIGSTCIDHIYNYYSGYDIDVIDDEYVSVDGIEDTIICITNNDISLVRSGIMQFDSIKTYLDENVQNITFNSYMEYPPYDRVYHNDDILKNIILKKPVYKLNFIDFDDLSKNSELIELTSKYLQNSVLIDFNKLAARYKDKFVGYVDLSEAGDYKEVLFNIYNIFHQLVYIECEKIFIYNFEQLGNENHYNKLIWNKINSITNGKGIEVPIQFL